jgi:hypothetical protein
VAPIRLHGSTQFLFNCFDEFVAVPGAFCDQLP